MWIIHNSLREEKREKETEEDKKVKQKIKKRALLLITYLYILYKMHAPHIYELDVHSNDTILKLSHISSRIAEEEALSYSSRASLFFFARVKNLFQPVSRNSFKHCAAHKNDDNRFKKCLLSSFVFSFSVFSYH